MENGTTDGGMFLSRIWEVIIITGHKDARSCAGYIGLGLRVILVLVLGLAGVNACTKTDASDLARRAGIEQNVGLYNAAIATWTKAIELGTLGKDDLVNAYINRAVAYRDKKQYDRAIEDLTRAIDLNPGYARAYAIRGTVYILTELYDRVIEDCSKAIDLDPKYAMAYNNRGVVYEIKREYDRAIQDFNRVVEFDPRDVRAYYNRGNAYAGKKQFDRAIEDWSMALELDPHLVDAHIRRGKAYSEKQQYDRAIEDFNKAIALKPGDAIGYTSRGYAHIKKREYSQAIEDYDKAIEINPSEVTPYYNKACVYSLMKNVQESCRWLGITVEKGYADWSTIRTDSDFKNIRNAACYKKLMAGK